MSLGTILVVILIIFLLGGLAVDLEDMATVSGMAASVFSARF